MATSKPKIQGYVEPDVFTAFEAFRNERGLSQSQALEIAVAGFLELDQPGSAITVDAAYSKRLTELESSLEDLNKLCKFSFRMAFHRLGKLEKGDTQEITGELPAEGDTQEITGGLPAEGDTQEITGDTLNMQRDTASKGNLLVICKLYKNNADDPSHWRYWAGSKQGFVSDLKLAKTYKDDAAVRRQLNQINASDHAATTRERISWKPYQDLAKEVKASTA